MKMLRKTVNTREQNKKKINKSQENTKEIKKNKGFKKFKKEINKLKNE